jgi:hypothetical protein
VSSTDIKSELITAIKKAYPSWTPKVGEWIYCEDCQRPEQFNKRSHHFRPLTEEEWVVHVEGVGKVGAEYDEDGNISMFNEDVPCWYEKEHKHDFALCLKICRDNNIPIKPYERSERQLRGWHPMLLLVPRKPRPNSRR